MSTLKQCQNDTEATQKWKYNRTNMSDEENRLENIQLKNFKERRAASIDKVHKRLEKVRNIKAR